MHFLKSDDLEKVFSLSCLDKISAVMFSKVKNFGDAVGFHLTEAESNSAVSLIILAGGISTINNIQGLPHLLEHIIVRNARPKISALGGTIKGYTSTNRMEFSVVCESDKLHECLISLVSSIKSIQTPEETLKAELKAINQEFESGLLIAESSILRILRLLANLNHPWHFLDCTSNETLITDSKRISIGELQAKLRQYHSNIFYLK